MTDDPFWAEVPDPPLHYDRLGVPISLREWADLMEDDSYRGLEADVISERYLVSTVWLGINHEYLGGPPLIFETMVFDREGKEPFHDLEMRRYATEAEARDGHYAVVALVRAIENLAAKESDEL